MFRLCVLLISTVLVLSACSQVSQLPSLDSTPALPETPDNSLGTAVMSTPQPDVGQSLALLGNDLYVVGYTYGSLEGNNIGIFDGFVRRSNGVKLWGQQFGTSADDRTTGVAMDSAGNVYVLGYTEGSLGYQVGGYDLFLLKYNKNGVLLWGQQFGSRNNDFAKDIVIDSNNRIYVLSDEGDNNFVIRKFNTSGTLLQTKSVTQNSFPSLDPRALAVDSLNNLVVLTDWNNTAGGRGYDARLYKYDSNLNQIWVKGYGTSYTDYAFDIATDSNNNIYFTLRVDAANQGARVVKKNSAGANLFSRRLEYSATSSNTNPYALAIDSSNNVYIAGNTGGAFATYTNAGSDDIVVFKYNASGTQQWVTQFGRGNYGSPQFDLAFAIAVNNDVYVTGYTSGHLVTGSATSFGALDVYVAKLDKATGNILGVDQ